MVGTISEAETRGVLWLRDKIEGYTVSVEIEGEEGLVSLNPVRPYTLNPYYSRWSMENGCECRYRRSDCSK